MPDTDERPDLALELLNATRELSNARTSVGHWRHRAEKAEAELRILTETMQKVRERTGAIRHELGVTLDELATRTMERDAARDRLNELGIDL